MDQRDSTRITPAGGRPGGPLDDDGDLGLDDDPGNPRPRRFPRLIGEPAARSHPPYRLAILLSAIVLAVVLLAAAGTRAVRRLISHVHAHPTYQLSYRDITLEPAPPRWFRGGSPAFLERVWDGAKEPHEFSSLDVDPTRLGLLFRRCAWVHKVLRVEVGHPRRVVVRLEYRTPVGVSAAADGSETWVDGEGVLLPPDDIDREAVAPVIGLHGFPAPAEPHFGEAWNQADARGGGTRPDPRVAEAAALAGFLKERIAELGTRLPRRPSAVVQLHGERGLILQITWGDTLADSLLIYWGNDPLADPAVRELTNAQKWEQLRDWVDRSPRSAGGRSLHLWFSRQGIALDTRWGGEANTGLNDRSNDGATRRR